MIITIIIVIIGTTELIITMKMTLVIKTIMKSFIVNILEAVVIILPEDCGNSRRLTKIRFSLKKVSTTTWQVSN